MVLSQWSCLVFVSTLGEFPLWPRIIIQLWLIPMVTTCDALSRVYPTSYPYPARIFSSPCDPELDWRKTENGLLSFQTALSSCLCNGGLKHDPFRLNIPCLPRNVGECMLEIGIEHLQNKDICQMFPTFIHPLSAASPGVGLRGQQLEQRSPDVPVPSHFLHLVRGDPHQPRGIVSPTCPGSSPGSSPSGKCPHQGGVQEAS